ncbi:MAG: type VI secretion system baseplate subunit TssG [Acidobacteria bacterium]|nr:type VI secretion system baseplate subunit TssG [Acidobacteriota bacterium]
MADQDRTSHHPLGELLLRGARHFSFFQLVRLLERCAGGSVRVGYRGPASAETIRFRPDTSLAFPASDVSKLQLVRLPDSEAQRFRITTTFLGLYGSSSPLPTFYSEEVLWADEDQSRLRDFLDLFHHRLLSLFYRCWSKYRYSIQFEYGEGDPLTPSLFSLIGLESPLLYGETGLPEPMRLLQFAGMIHQQPHSASALESILNEYFDGLPVEVEPCTGRWVPIKREQLARLGRKNCRLNADCSIGSRVYARTGNFRIRIGPVLYRQFLDFLPDRPNHRTLCSLVDFFATDRLEFDIAFEVLQPPRLQLQSKDPQSPNARLGWTSWLLSAPSPEDRKETVVFNRASPERIYRDGSRPEGMKTAS